MTISTQGIAAMLAIAAVAALGQAPPGPAPNQAEIAAQEARFAQWRKTPFPGTGPYRATRLEVPSLPGHTIYVPADLKAVAGSLPIVSFGNGGCRNTSIEFTKFLGEIASRGYFVIAAGRNDVDFATTDFAAKSVNGEPLQVTDPQILVRAVDWAVAENGRRGSSYRNKLDTRAIAYVGQSCGGIQALTASADPRTTTTVVLNSGYLDASGLPAGLKLALPTRVPWTALHAPIAYFIGGPTDMAYKWANQNFSEIEKIPVFKADMAVGHTGAYPGPDLGFASAVTAWLDWHLKKNKDSSAWFVGPDCGLCLSPEWSEVSSKNFVP